MAEWTHYTYHLNIFGFQTLYYTTSEYYSIVLLVYYNARSSIQYSRCVWSVNGGECDQQAHSCLNTHITHNVIIIVLPHHTRIYSRCFRTTKHSNWRITPCVVYKIIIIIACIPYSIGVCVRECQWSCLHRTPLRPSLNVTVPHHVRVTGDS